MDLRILSRHFATVVGALFINILLANTSHASFTCGPHLKTYRVHHLGGVEGHGVRCALLLNDGRSPLGNWYGEGYWQNVTYRHLGSMFEHTARAADISGNGEGASNIFPEGSLKVFAFGSNAAKIIVKGAGWNEEWLLEPDGVVHDYTSRLPPLRNCGPHYTRYVVQGIPGVRCVSHQDQISWYGEGNWAGGAYAHIGSGISYPEGSRFLARDICEPSRYKACGSVPIGGLRFLGQPGIISRAVEKVTGAWNEVWVMR